MGDRQIHLKDLAGIDVIVVDDSASMRQLTALVLSSFGIGSIRSAESGPETLDLMKEKQPNLLIVDWEMKPMDGLTLIRHIRARANFQNAFVPIVVLTAHSQPHIVRLALKHGASQFLTKPLVPQTLLNRLLWALNDRRPFVERDGFFVHAAAAAQSDKSAPKPESGLRAPAVQVPKPDEMWVIE